MRYYIHNFLATVSLFLISGMFSGVNAQYCVPGNCNPNTYINSSDPNTIEYDNMVSVFHSTIVRESDGKVKIWGQGTAQNGTGQTNNIAPPQEINSANYGSGGNQLTGTILKFAGGSNQNNQQFAVLSTSGLYIWSGSIGTMVPLTATNNVAAGSFRKVAVGTYNVSGGATKADGLPDGVTPGDVKMMFGTRDGLAIVTCTGAAWVLSSNGNAYGDGATDNAANDIVWHRVSTAANTPLTKVVAVRGAYQTMMALTADGDIYTWGEGARLGDTNGPASLPYATLMQKPAGVTPKMIGMTYSSSATGGNVAGRSYYLLATDGRLYSMGQNAQRQLGDGTTSARNIWVQVTASTTVSGTTYSLGSNIVWISPQEHDGNGGYAAINVITNDGKLWAWGSNNNGMIAGNTATTGDHDPIFMPGRTTGAYDATRLNLTDRILAVEMGGHTTLTIKQCTTKFGYVGHKINGSMANNTTDSGTEPNYNYGDTAVLSVCGAVAGPVVEDLKICEGTTANLVDAEPASLPDGVTGIKWWQDAAGTIPVTNPGAVDPGTYYATFDPATVFCPTPMTVSYLQPGDPGYELCGEICTEPVDGNTFQWNIPSSTDPVVTQNIVQPASNYGFVFDIYQLDNSFNLNINGTLIAAQELQFQSDGTSGINVAFADGDEYEADTTDDNGDQADIWQMRGNAAHPLIRVQISPSGAISLFGSKTSYGPLFPLVLNNGNTLNNITWNHSATNNITVTQNVVGVTLMDGYGYGLNTVPCACYNPAVTPGTGPDTKVGISLLKRAGSTNPDNWPMARKSGHIVLESNTRGFVPTRMTTAQLEAIKTANNAVEGMMSYDTDAKCLKIYDGTSWTCFNTPACP